MSSEIARKRRALAGVVAMAGGYVLISIAFVRWSDFSPVFAGLTPPLQAVGAGFLEGAVIQLLLVFGFAFGLRSSDVQRALRSSLAPAARPGWIIAGIATAIHLVIGVLFLIPSPGAIWDASTENVLLSAISALDGWTQEVMFRGYVLFRLARAGVTSRSQALVSGALFASIHAGYVGVDFWGAAAPLAGTFLLGAMFAWSVQRGGSLKPVIIGHMLIIVVLQPWLALAR